MNNGEVRGTRGVLGDAVAASVNACPAPILGAEWASEALTVWGDGWSFSTMSSWRLSRHGALVASTSHDPELAGEALRSATLVEVRARQGWAADDPVLLFDGGLILEVAADMPVEPWVFRLPTATYVPSCISESRS